MNKLFKFGLYFVAVFFFVLFGFPFVITFLMSFKSQQDYMSGNYWGLPKVIFFGNYQKILFSSFFRYFVNSTLIATAALICTIIIASMASYAFAKLKFKFSGILLLIFMSGMMIPIHTTLIPIYQMTKSIGMTDNLWGLLGPYISFGLPVAIYILTSFFKDVPDSIQESALIDGASHFRIYWSIMMPLSVPAISTVGIYNFLASWNEFIYSLTLINSNTKKTLPLGIREFYGTEMINIPSVITAIFVGSLPVIIFYLLAQEKVINGLSAGAVKG